MLTLYERMKYIRIIAVTYLKLFLTQNRKSMTRIALLDKQELFRQSLESLFQLNGGKEVVLSTGSFTYFQNSLSPGMADILIVDIKDISNEEWDVLKEAAHHHPAMQIIALSELICKETLTRLMLCRVRGYYSKLINSTSLLTAISEIGNNFNPLDLKLGPAVREQLQTNGSLPSSVCEEHVVKFSERELQILKMIAREMTNVEISQVLSLSVRTIETHRRRMIEKTGSKTMLGVIVYAKDHNLGI